MTEDTQIRLAAFASKVLVAVCLAAIAHGIVLIIAGSIISGFAWVVLSAFVFCLALVAFLILAQR